MLKNTPDSYGIIAQMFHWIIALAIIAMIPFGWYMEGVAPPEKYALYGLHKSIGMTVLLLVIGRICWRLYTGGVAQMATHPKWERVLATTVHYTLYALIFLMPLSGYTMSVAGGHPVSLFGLPVPALFPESKALGSFASGAHSAIAWALVVTVGLHVIGALKHIFIDKDGTLKRMLP